MWILYSIDNPLLSCRLPAKLNWRNGSIPFIRPARPPSLGTEAKLGHCTCSKRKSTAWKKASNPLKSWNTWPNCKSRWWATRRTEVKFLLKSGIGKTPWSACTANNSGSGATWHHCKMESFQIPRYLRVIGFLLTALALVGWLTKRAQFFKFEHWIYFKASRDLHSKRGFLQHEFFSNDALNYLVE